VNGTQQHLVYADDVNILAGNINTTKKATEALLEAGRKVGLKINADKSMYMFMSYHQNAGKKP